VVSDGDVLGDLVAERGLGRTVPFEDDQAWAETVGELLDDAEAYEAAQTNLASVRDELAWPKVVSALRRLLEAETAPLGAPRSKQLLAEYYGLAARNVVLDPRAALGGLGRPWRA
jgi:hypothetical protein